MQANKVSWSLMNQVPLYLAGAAAVAAPISIAACQILMGATAAALIVTRSRWRLPPVWIALALFMLGTLLSGAASGHFRAGWPPYKKFFVYLMLLLLFPPAPPIKTSHTIYS